MFEHETTIYDFVHQKVYNNIVVYIINCDPAFAREEDNCYFAPQMLQEADCPNPLDGTYLRYVREPYSHIASRLSSSGSNARKDMCVAS
jgi:hypothetical protein